MINRLTSLVLLLQVIKKKGYVFSGGAKYTATMANRVVAAYAYIQQEATDEMWKAHWDLGKAVLRARQDGEHETAQNLKDELMVACDGIVHHAKKAYLENFFASDAYLKAGKPSAKKNAAKAAISTLGFGSRVQKEKLLCRSLT